MSKEFLYAEQCLVVKRDLLEKEGFFKGFPKVDGVYCGIRKITETESLQFIDFVEEHKEFRNRFGKEGVEEDPSYQQIICYQVIIFHNDFYVYQRKIEDPKYPEKRLEGKLSVGIGGHVDPGDEQFIHSLYRELQEELIITYEGKELSALVTDRNNLDEYLKIRPIALIKDDTNSVGRVHVGLVTFVEPQKNLLFQPRENQEIIFGKFVDKRVYNEMVKDTYQPESWTEIVVRELLS